jgi:dihydroorotate dehydrogenase (fumarate)
LKISLAANTGIHRMEGALKLLLAGADVTMMASALLKRGPSLITTMLDQLQVWLEEHEYQSVAQLKGSMSRGNVADPSAFERGNYMKALINYTMEHPLPG